MNLEGITAFLCICSNFMFPFFPQTFVESRLRSTSRLFQLYTHVFRLLLMVILFISFVPSFRDFIYKPAALLSCGKRFELSKNEFKIETNTHSIHTLSVTLSPSHSKEFLTRFGEIISIAFPLCANTWFTCLSIYKLTESHNAILICFTAGARVISFGGKIFKIF